MKRFVDHDPAGREARQLVYKLFGSPGLFFAAVGALTVSAWLASATYEIAGSLVAGRLPENPKVVIAGLSIFLLVVILWLARHATIERPYRVRLTTDPPPVRALILFLSRNPNEGPATYLNMPSVPLGDPAWREFMGKKSWRMPIEAIAYHAFRLEKVVILTSSENAATPGQGGSNEVFDQFVRILRGLQLDPRLEILSSADFGLEATVNFFDCEAVYDMTDKIFKELEKQYPENDILIDITSGTKVSTFAAQAVAFAGSRRCMYVNTNNYQVSSFDPTYSPDQS